MTKTLPQSGGSFTRTEKGALKPAQTPTKPPVKAKPAKVEPTGQTTEKDA